MDKEKLIEAVREYTLLYDQRDKLYSDSEKKDAVWRKIGKNLNQPYDLCKQQWNNLRDAYRRHLKKRKRKCGQNVVDFKKWKYEEEMSFLTPFLKERESVSSVKMSLSEDEADDGEETQTSSADINAVEIANQEEVFPKPITKRKRQDAESSSVFDDYLLKEKKGQDMSDEIDLFFASIAKTVKWFSPYNKALAKAHVFGIVSELELKELSDSSSNHLNPPHTASTFSTYSSSSNQSNQQIEIQNSTTQALNCSRGNPSETAGTLDPHFDAHENSGPKFRRHFLMPFLQGRADN